MFATLGSIANLYERQNYKEMANTIHLRPVYFT